MPNWFPWIFVGGLIFIALSFTASKYKDKDYKKIQAEVKDTSATSSWLGEVLSEIDNNK